MEDTLKKFDDFYYKLKKNIILQYRDDDDSSLSINKALNHLEKVIDYNVPFGKKLRGLCTYESFLILKNNESNENMEEKAKALGWCIELLQASFLVADDIMDNSKTRRGQPCWYLNNGIGNIAINDGYYLLSCVYLIIKKYLSNHEMYHKFYELFNEVLMQTTIGQTMDLLFGSPQTRTELFDFTNYTKEIYDAIVKWKTAYYSFYLPVACALYLANIDDESVHLKCKQILLQMGHFFQVQDDYLDCYGDYSVMGKIGTDIEESKCSWLIVQALDRVNEEQKLELKQNYGKTSEENVKKVKSIFNELNLKEAYKIFEENQYRLINEKIDNLNVDDSRIKILLNLYVKKIFKRNS